MNLRLFTPALALIAALGLSASGQSSSCQYWRSRVDIYTHITDLSQILDEKNPKNMLPAIRCLLEFEGNKNIAAFGLDPNPRLTGPPGPGPMSILSTPITAEVAALYFISYLYYQKWDHANLVVLIDKEDSREIESSQENVSKAYKYYREWFERVKPIGIVKARKLKIEPLKGKDVRWR